MIRDPAETLLAFFPRELLNFDTPPIGMTIGPLHAIFSQAGQMIANFQADALLGQTQLSVQYAAGPYLDEHAVFYGTTRLVGETDDALRARLLLIINAGKLTIPAIAAAVTLYYATALRPHLVTVYDRQSNPTAAAAVVYVDPTGATVNGLQPLDFVIDIHIEIPASLVFFAGRSYAGRNSYVVSLAPYITMNPGDPRLVAEVLRVKAGGTNPIYSFTRDIAAHA